MLNENRICKQEREEKQEGGVVSSRTPVLQNKSLFLYSPTQAIKVYHGGCTASKRRDKSSERATNTQKLVTSEAQLCSKAG